VAADLAVDLEAAVAADLVEDSAAVAADSVDITTIITDRVFMAVGFLARVITAAVVALAVCWALCWHQLFW
jgi:hypothetical protein